MKVTGLKRSFRIKRGSETILLQDPLPNETPEAVMNYYSNLYPELTTATVQGPAIEDDCAVYDFKTTIGTKG